ncbi:MAG: DNA methyltransferase [Thermoguttaceae bacterium]
MKQSDGSFLTPFQQAKRYATELPYSKRPRWIVTCNFEEFLIYDMEKPDAEPESVLLKNLPKEYSRLQFLVDEKNENIKRETEISVNAGKIVGQLYDELYRQYKDPESPETARFLNVLCVRLVFCLYAEDAGLFGARLAFHDYLKTFSVQDTRRAIIDLFKVLDQNEEERDEYLDDRLKVFPYVNGGLFSEEIIIPQFNDKIVDLLLNEASEGFDWSQISPTIFGAVFESTLNPETRRSGGMHYTSIENIHKAIDPLFLDELREEFKKIKDGKQPNVLKEKLLNFQKKLGSLTFFDPACGSGNFLTETYICLRRLENATLSLIYPNKLLFSADEKDQIVKVSIKQFYGIEINDFAVSVAKTALWIAESQMIAETESILQTDMNFLPLKAYANIVEGNALTLNWEKVFPKEEASYIMGNPPFIGARMKDKKQKDEVFAVFEDVKGAGELDYVACWYKKCADYIQGTKIQCALVSTNSICQGIQAGLLWKELAKYGVRINFAHKTFKWNSESAKSAAVHCVIVGFATFDRDKKELFFHFKNDKTEVKRVTRINEYLTEQKNVFIQNRTSPLCNVPELSLGTQPIDGGFYIFEYEEMLDFVKKEPGSKSFFYPWYGAKEFITQRPRYFLLLKKCPPNVLKGMPECMKRVKAVSDYRQKSSRPVTRELALTPLKFGFENIPDSTFLIIPETSSENRRYIPIGFFKPDNIPSNLVKIVPHATLYHFGILTSHMHMVWTNAVCGRLEMRFRYSGGIVYNNFPWPSETAEMRAKIETAAQVVLNARSLYRDCSLDVLYDPNTMPDTLYDAHKKLDALVDKAYRGRKFDSDDERLSFLFDRYLELTSNVD